MAKRVTAKRLRQLLDYNPATGIFKWRAACQTRRKGLVAGNRHRNWYWVIRVDDQKYLAHRLAWLYVYGHWPVDQIDHINGIRFDNRIANLREATRIQNRRNYGVTKMFFGLCAKAKVKRLAENSEDA